MLADEKPFYSSIVVCQDKIVVLDINAWKVQIHQLRDGKLLGRSDVFESRPRDMCLMDAMLICIIHEDGLINMMSIDFTDISRVCNTTRKFRLPGVLDKYHAVVRFNENLVVSGAKQGFMYWCIVSLDDGHVDSIHQICKGYWKSYLATKDTMIFISCDAGYTSPYTGVYGFDILNPSQCKYIYKHQHLKWPTSIVINEDGNIFVCNYGKCFHQLTDLCQLVSIFTKGIPGNIRAMFWDHGRLYCACFGSSDITLFEVGNQKNSEQQGKQIELSLKENLNQAGIEMSTERQDLFLRFQQEIGTTIFFSKDPQTLIDEKESLNATEMFLQENRPDMKDKWLEYTKQGKLTHELIDAIYAKERYPELHDKKDDFLGQMKQLNIIVKPWSFEENGLKEEDYFLTHCMLQQESPREVISPKHDSRIVSTSVLCFVLTESVMQARIFNELLAAFLRRWPVAKKMETSENLVFCNCAVYDLDLFHRLILHYRNRVVFARVTRMVCDKADTPDAKLCIRVRKFITLNLRNITSRLDPNLKYELYVQSQESQDVSEDSMVRFPPPFHIWCLDEEHDPDSPITREHMNHARLNVALVTVCGKAMRDILLANFDTQYKDIYQAILAKKGKLIPTRGKPLLNQHQQKLVYPDPMGQKTGTVEQFDISLLYTLIRNVSTVLKPTTLWGNDPHDIPRDTSIGASVERIRSYRNLISGHSPYAKMEQEEFEEYWTKFDAVLHDIENALGKHVYCSELAKHKSQVISVYEA